MGKAKNHFARDYTASIGERDTFAMIYDGQMKSRAFQELKAGEKLFYIFCRVQASSRDGRSCLFEHGEAEGKIYNPDVDFVFPASHMEKYGYDRSNGNKLLQALEEKGFIRKREGNQHRFKVNVYSFVSDWKKQI